MRYYALSLDPVSQSYLNAVTTMELGWVLCQLGSAVDVYTHWPIKTQFKVYELHYLTTIVVWL